MLDGMKDLVRMASYLILLLILSL